MAAVRPLDEVEQQQLRDFLAKTGADMAVALEGWLPVVSGTDEDDLFACMRYSVLGDGKRMRPALVLGSYLLAGGQAAERTRSRAIWAGAAMEMIHTYSLMQDDLPCMDNDDLRRGRPTAHKQFNETTAILASDGLQTGAFELLADARVHPDSAVRLELVRLFARGAGALGMVGGQMVDMMWEWQRGRGEALEIDVVGLTRMNRLKTGALIEASCVAGAVLAGNEEMREVLRKFGVALGRAYQVFDDVLDVVGTADVLGKTPGKDAAAGKATFATLLGLEGARAEAEAQAQAALAVLASFGEEANMLRLLARFCVTRKS
ncbi:MAG: polyprenyl synthetase family protein [Proteobacteria bacterium]|nr:polyprenyl synthetase family protein [Pseudomonadota bacterium]